MEIYLHTHYGGVICEHSLKYRNVMLRRHIVIIHYQYHMNKDEVKKQRESRTTPLANLPEN